MNEEPRFCIVLRCKHTGDEIHLGSMYDTIDEAQAYINSDVCLRCNYVNINHVMDGMVWSGKRSGFVSPEYNKEIKEGVNQ